MTCELQRRLIANATECIPFAAPATMTVFDAVPDIQYGGELVDRLLLDDERVVCERAGALEGGASARWSRRGVRDVLVQDRLDGGLYRRLRRRVLVRVPPLVAEGDILPASGELENPNVVEHEADASPAA